MVIIVPKKRNKTDNKLQNIIVTYFLQPFPKRELIIYRLLFLIFLLTAFLLRSRLQIERELIRDLFGSLCCFFINFFQQLLNFTLFFYLPCNQLINVMIFPVDKPKLQQKDHHINNQSDPVNIGYAQLQIMRIVQFSSPQLILIIWTLRSNEIKVLVKNVYIHFILHKHRTEDLTGEDELHIG